ncbi:hypothetical protein BHE74_00027750 [Ensete ventricosum]|nr:hypothetical protein BHE74_00027750 [Ensete ventricosum]
MAQQEKREAFEEVEEEEESLSLSDLPEVIDEAMDEECKTGEATDDFEFQISVAGGLLSSSVETDMCAADEVFFQGQILPLQPSISPGSGLSRRSSSGRKSNAAAESAKKAPSGTTKSRCAKSHAVCGRGAQNQQKTPPRPGGRGFICKCSSDAVEPIAMSKLTITRK